MNYEFILKDIRPNKEEIDSVSKTAHKILDFLNETCRKENIPAKAMFVGSFSKKTWLSGKSDIDIFIHFQEKGLYLGYKTSDYFNGTPSEHFASHPYLTSEIDGIEVDFVPCYLIKDASELKSAVDRTILHTRYIKSHLKDEQIDEVLLLKKPLLFQRKKQTTMYQQVVIIQILIIIKELMLYHLILLTIILYSKLKESLLMKMDI